MSSPLAPWVKVRPDGSIDFSVPSAGEEYERHVPSLAEKVAAFVRENPLLSLGGAALATYFVVRR